MNYSKNSEVDYILNIPSNSNEPRGTKSNRKQNKFVRSVFFFSILMNWLSTQKVQLDLSFVRSIKKLLQLNRWCFGLGMGIIKTWEAKNSKFPELIWRTRHLKPADFSTLNFQVLIVRLSQDLVSVHIFESKNHLE